MKFKIGNGWTILFWFSVMVLLIWAIGKSVGLIHSPVWVEMLPYSTGALALISVGAKAGKALQKLDNVVGAISKLEKDVSAIKLDIKEIQKKATCLSA